VERTMSRTTGGTLGPVTCVNDTAWIAKLMGDPKGLPEQLSAGVQNGRYGRP
jgi:hypothetical protein